MIFVSWNKSYETTTNTDVFLSRIKIQRNCMHAACAPWIFSVYKTVKTNIEEGGFTKAAS